MAAGDLSPAAIRACELVPRELQRRPHGASVGDGGGWDREHMSWSRLPVFWQLFIPNALILAVAGIGLMFLPITVSEPILVREGLIVTAGLAAMVVINVVAMRRAMAPLQRLASAMAVVDPLAPGRRIGGIEGSPEIEQLALAFDEMAQRLEAERRNSTGLMLEAQERERLRLARELHDELGQALTGVMLALSHTARQSPPGVQPALHELRDEVRHLSVDVGRIVKRLRPEALEDLGLRSALATLADRLSYQAGIVVRRRLDRPLPKIRRETELVIYRVAQEALNNATRHSEADLVELRLQRHGECLELTVRDDGKGLDGAAPHSGIQGMRERAVLVGAELHVGTRPAGGTEVCLRVPLEGDSS